MLTEDRRRRLCAARKLLQHVGHHERSIDEVASAAAMSRYHFIRQFKAVFGETPVQYRTRARLERAKRLLSQSDQSITDICMTVGFSSLGSFSTLFSQRVGQSPSAYRLAAKTSALPPAPTCTHILWAAWSHDSQNSRSAAVAS